MSFKSLRFFLCLSLGTLSMPVFADNAVQMVTYFPVPYAAYNNVFVSQKFDVGTNTGNFTLDLGDASSCDEGTSLKAKRVNLAHITSNSALGFNTDIYTQSALFGKQSVTDGVGMEFNKLRIDTLNGNKAQAVAEIDAKDVTVQGDMYMFEDSFMTDGAALPECTDAKWKNLQIGNKTGYYLVCGEGTASTGTSPCDISTHTTVYNACINSGGSWNANATSAETCCTCPGNSVPSGDGSCPTTTTRCYVNTGEKPAHPDTSLSEGIFSCKGSDVFKVPCSPGTICACAEVGTFAWHGEESYTHYQRLPNGHEIDRDFVRAHCVECREVPENECTIILADK